MIEIRSKDPTEKEKYVMLSSWLENTGIAKAAGRFGAPIRYHAKGEITPRPVRTQIRRHLERCLEIR